VRVGIFGGTFDPPHIGHLIAAQDALDVLSLDSVVFIPARVPPHKQHENVTEAAVRLRMIQAAAAHDARFEVSDAEVRRNGPSYTVDTLRDLHEKRPNDELFLLLGVDQVQEFSTWRGPQEILRLARLAMLERAGVEHLDAGDIVHQTVPVTRVDVYSKLVRERVAAGRSIRYLVPESVEKIIAAERLYSRGSG
jgi:nicotinate-nucleotide adenylyltransferase